MQDGALNKYKRQALVLEDAQPRSHVVRGSTDGGLHFARKFRDNLGKQELYIEDRTSGGNPT